MKTKISFTITPNLKKEYDDQKHISQIDTYAKKAFISRLMHDRQEQEIQLKKKIKRKLPIVKKEIIEKYPLWLRIDTYDDMGARSSKRNGQELWDRNPKCTICGMNLQKHCDNNGRTNQDHFFAEREK